MIQGYDVPWLIEPGKILLLKNFEEREYSEEVGAKIDSEVNKIIDDAMKRASKIITDHRDALNDIAERLIEVETIEQKEFEEILIRNKIKPKRKLDLEHQK